jgi:hypothetical protein
MKSYKYLTLMVLLGMTLLLFGMASSTYATSTPVDPTIILRGCGVSCSMPIEGVGFGGFFPTTPPPDTPPPPFACFNSDGGALEPNSNCFQNANEFTFTGIHLTFDNLALAYSCDNSQDTLFTNCSVSDNEVTFSGINNNFFRAFGDFESSTSDGCFGGFQGINGGCHFALDIVGLPDGVKLGYEGLADTAVTNTPEPASSLLFVIAMGAIAVFLKRRNGLATA